MAWRLEDQLPLGGSQCQARGPEALSLGLALSACKAEIPAAPGTSKDPRVLFSSFCFSFFQGIIFEKKHKTTETPRENSMNTSPHSLEPCPDDQSGNSVGSRLEIQMGCAANGTHDLSGGFILTHTQFAGFPRIQK